MLCFWAAESSGDVKAKTSRWKVRQSTSSKRTRDAKRQSTSKWLKADPAFSSSSCMPPTPPPPLLPVHHVSATMVDARVILPRDGVGGSSRLAGMAVSLRAGKDCELRIRKRSTSANALTICIRQPCSRLRRALVMNQQPKPHKLIKGMTPAMRKSHFNCASTVSMEYSDAYNNTFILWLCTMHDSSKWPCIMLVTGRFRLHSK
mmetsp:Transcript_75586/g.169239  ORF Transcript_75586/g.169239 Transcript_75586/m.169239 type:complete len:204 (+) Transcript_75586:126-737(+)